MAPVVRRGDCSRSRSSARAVWRETVPPNVGSGPRGVRRVPPAGRDAPKRMGNVAIMRRARQAWRALTSGGGPSYGALGRRESRERRGHHARDRTMSNDPTLRSSSDSMARSWIAPSGSAAAHYGLAIALTISVTLMMHELDPWWDVARRHPYLFEWPTVIAAAWLGGFGPGLVATVLASGSILFFWVEPFGTLRVRHASDLVGLSLFALCGVVVSVLIASLHRARAREELLRHSRETILGIVAHDLRNPLASIVAATSLVRLKPQELRPLDVIDRSARRMDHLIRDLLDASVIDSDGALSMVLQRESVVSVVIEAVAAAMPVAIPKAIQIVTEPFDDLCALCDRERMLQVLGNLLGNAVKFTPEGGRITLRVTRMQAFARIEVADSGPGIKPAQQEAVFDRHWTGNRPGAGAGLGLFIARAIVRAHGGRLWLHCEPGRGATFVLTIPVADPGVLSTQAVPDRLLFS